MSERLALSLDIGTRKVVGLLTTPGPKGLKIMAAEKIEHATRSMLDGQIHDVVEVAQVVARIVEKLSAKAGAPLTEASVAAAGRALRTIKGTAVRELSGLTELTHEEVFSLELEAVQSAQGTLAQLLREGEEPEDYHYVGHSVMGARLDGLPIGNLVGQRGNLAQVDVIATFLPRGVVDSLLAVLQRNGLEMTALTLEPIAALTVAVPQSMRHLNLALVDIGAGTSDIAITANRSVIAYDMVPMAGDEITEALSEAYLLDFNVGEEVKRRITKGGSVTFQDILGQRYTVKTEQLVEAIQPAARRLAEQIAQRILNLNGGQPPQAILLVGGGSLTTGLPAELARAVGLVEQRVAVRGRDAIAGVEGAKSLLNGPDAVTPIGIAVAARDRSTLGFVYLHVNGRGVRLFHPSMLTVADALLAAGIAIRDLQGQIGKGFTVTINGQLRLVRGTFGRPARITLNGEPASLETPVTHRDKIRVEPGTQGEPGRAAVRDLAPQVLERMTLTVNGAPQDLSPLITVNGVVVGADHELKDNDVVVIRAIKTVEDALLHLGFEDPSALQTIRYSLDGKTQSAQRPRYRIRLNGAEAAPETPLRSGDRLEVTTLGPLTLREVAATLLDQATAIRITVNGRLFELHTGAELSRNGMKVEPDEPLTDNDAIALTRTGADPIFASLLPMANITPTPPPGKSNLVMRLNGADAEFTTPLKDGDVAEIRWE
ncbi:MAG: cell division FtsA domain-containing protein [Bacillota bacterium]